MVGRHLYPFSLALQAIVDKAEKWSVVTDCAGVAVWCSEVSTLRTKSNSQVALAPLRVLVKGSCASSHFGCRAVECPFGCGELDTTGHMAECAYFLLWVSHKFSRVVVSAFSKQCIVNTIMGHCKLNSCQDNVPSRQTDLLVLAVLLEIAIYCHQNCRLDEVVGVDDLFLRFNSRLAYWSRNICGFASAVRCYE